VRRRIPAGGLKRGLAFLFFNGAAGGLVWAVLLLLITFAATAGVLTWSISAPSYVHSMSATDIGEFIRVSAIVIAYVLAYMLTGLFIQRKFLGNRPPKLAGLFAMLIAAGMALIPNIALFFMNRLSWKSLEKLQLGNVFNLFVKHDQNDHLAHLAFSLCWLAVMLVLNVKWFSTQARNFRRLEPGMAPGTGAPPLVPPVPPPFPAQA
jgi:hypothetical protein